MTLEGVNHDLNYFVTLRTADELERDKVVIDGHEEKGEIYQRIVNHLNVMRQYIGFNQKLVVYTRKTFPIASGLAGSAAVASALAEAFVGLVPSHLDKRKVSILARYGSGSASRSVYGGFVKWQKGTDNDTSFALQVFDEKHWDIRDVIALSDTAPKKVVSRDGMRLSTLTCRHDVYSHFVNIAELNIDEAGLAIRSKDIERLGRVYESENLLFRKVCLNTTPPLDYWSKVTLKVVEEVENLRNEGVPAYAGTDAGPNVHILVQARDAEKLIRKIKYIEGVNEIIHSKVGAGSRLLEEHIV